METEPKRRIVGPGFHDRVYEIVKRIPIGRVAAYADVAGALGSRRVGRHVGYALAAIPEGREEEIPWHRVVNAKGMVSRRSDGECSPEQVLRLKAEGVDIDGRGRIADFASRRLNIGDLTPDVQRRRMAAAFLRTRSSGCSFTSRPGPS